MAQTTPRPQFRAKIGESPEPQILIDKVVELTKFSKSLVKKILNYGGVWVNKERVKRVNRELKAGDEVKVFYQAQLLEDPQHDVVMLKERHHWGVWIKPAGMNSAQTPYGDQGTLLHAVQLQRPKAHLQGRLDREVAGLTLLSYSSKAHKLFAKPDQDVWRKFYLARIEGELPVDADYWIDCKKPLDGKACHTRYRVIDSLDGQSVVDIEILSGRFHQIRRHFSMIGHPLVGDLRYGKKNKQAQTTLNLVCYKFILLDPMDLKAPPKTLKLPLSHWPDFAATHLHDLL
jgi:tRNA pseudouridine32 synthase / 23S rRNA pseudouridine746 synthase